MKIYNFGKPMDETIATTEIKGMKVIDDRGKELGHVKAIHIDPETLTVEGIRLDKGLFKGKDYIGKQYITSLSDKGAVLTTTPISEYLGMKVYDKQGKELGKVKGFYRANKTNNVYSITVDRKSGPDLTITQDFIGSIGENIVLNKPVEA